MIKRILAIGIIGMTLAACSQDKKSTENTDKKTTATTENTEKTTTEEEKAAPVVMAISDSAGVYTQKFVLEKGKTYPFSSTQKEIQTIKDHTGKSMSGTQEVVDERNVVVENFENGVYELTLNIVGKKMTSTAEGKTVVIDTKAAAPKEEQLKNIWNINKVLAGSKFTVKMKENGEVISISGINDLYAKIEKAVSPLIKDTKAKKAFIEQFKQGFNEKLIKEEFSKGINILPKKGVKIGESWTETDNITPDGKVKSSVTYTLAKVENGIAEISIKGGIPLKSEKQTQQGVTATISIQGTQQGNITIDQNTGWIKKSTLNIKTTNKQSMTDGKQTESVTQTSDSTITIN